VRTVHTLVHERVEVVNLPEPEPHDDFVVVKVISSALIGSYESARSGHVVDLSSI
jgi:hypothetical protein